MRSVQSVSFEPRPDPEPMINVAAIRMQQFGVQFYQASLTASDIDKLVRFEVLNYGDNAQPPRARRQGASPARRAVEGELGSARAAHRVEREGVSAPDHPPQDRRARAVLRAVPAGARPAVDSRRRHHQLRREAVVPGRRRRCARRHPEGAGARRHPARDRRPAPAARAARRHRSLRGRGLQRAGDHLRPAARRSRRPDVRHDQREAHAAERVAPGQPVGPAAVPRRGAGDGARRRARAERPRGLAALRRDQAARRRPRPRRAGAARAGAEEAVRRRTRSRRGARATCTKRRRSSSSTTSSRSRWSSAAPGTAASTASESASALRAFIRVAPDVIRRLDQEHADRTDFRAIGRVIAPWGRRIGDLRFETEGAWKRGGTTVDSLAKELRLALQYPGRRGCSV